MVENEVVVAPGRYVDISASFRQVLGNLLQDVNSFDNDSCTAERPDKERGKKTALMTY